MAKKITNLSKQVFVHTGQAVVDETGAPTLVKNILANILALGDAGKDRAAMANAVAVTLYNAKDEIILENAEYELINDMLSQARLANVSRAACLEVLNIAEDIQAK